MCGLGESDADLPARGPDRAWAHDGHKEHLELFVVAAPVVSLYDHSGRARCTCRPPVPFYHPRLLLVTLAAARRQMHQTNPILLLLRTPLRPPRPPTRTVTR